MFEYLETILTFIKKYLKNINTYTEVDKKKENILESTLNKLLIKYYKDNLNGVTRIINLPRNNFGIESYKGKIIKLKVAHNLKRIEYNKKLELENILIYKSDKHLDITDLSNVLFEENEIIVNFIENFLMLNNINLILVIGCDINYKVKEILNSYRIIYFSWLSWKNYQVRKILNLGNFRLLTR